MSYFSSRDLPRIRVAPRAGLVTLTFCISFSVPGIGTLQRQSESGEERERRMARMTEAVRTLLECVGEDPEREGLLKTPERYAKALQFFTKGYEDSVMTVINDAVFNENHDEMVIVRDIDIFSMCEHHMVPFTGKVQSNHSAMARVTDCAK